MKQILGISLISILFVVMLLSIPSFAVAGSLEYIYDGAGRLVMAISDTGETALYQYDEVGNLISVNTETSVHQTLPPSLESVDPDTFVVGDEYNITLTGQNLFTTNSLSSDNPNITIISVFAIDTKIIATLKVSNGTSPGQANLIATTDYGSASLPVGLHKALISPTEVMLVPSISAPFTISLTPSAAKDVQVKIKNKSFALISTPSSAIIPTGGSSTFAVKAQMAGRGTFMVGDSESRVLVFDSIPATASPVSVVIGYASGSTTIQSSRISVNIGAVPNWTARTSRGISVGFPYSINSLEAKPVGVAWSSVQNAAVVSSPVSVRIGNN